MSEKSAWQKYKEKNGVTPLDLINPNTPKSEYDVATQRLAMCLVCEHLIKLTHQCKKCGCFMNVKTKLADAKCPIGKW